jgi:hypothetical protein
MRLPPFHLPPFLPRLHAHWFAGIAFAVWILILQPATLARADAPDQPIIDRVTALSATSVRVSFQNFADEAYGPNDCDGCAELLHFDIRYHPPSDTTGSQYFYIVGDLNDANGNPNNLVDGCLYPLSGSCSSDYVEPAAPGFAHYDVSGLSPGRAYCFGVQAVANEIPVFGTASMAYSGYSTEQCTQTTAVATPVPTFGPVATATPVVNSLLVPHGPIAFVPTVDPSYFVSPPPAQASVILSPTANQLVHDVQINVVRGQQDKHDGVFDLQWSYLQGGTWYTLDPGPMDVLDKSSYPNGASLPNLDFTQFTCGSDAAPCQFRNWRVRARIDGGPPGYWSDWVQFRVQ